jgi:hypothetical protein
MCNCNEQHICMECKCQILKKENDKIIKEKEFELFLESERITL